MKTAYVVFLVFLACATLLFGGARLFFFGDALALVQGVFNAMIAVGALLSYRES